MDRVEDIRNRVFKTTELAFGKDKDFHLVTNSSSVYRVTGYDQIVDIINTGYVRSKEGKLKGRHTNEVFWTSGGDKLFYFDKRPVIEVKSELLKDNQIGAININDIEAIWLFNEEENKYENKILEVKKEYLLKQKEELFSTLEEKSRNIILFL